MFWSPRWVAWLVICPKERFTFLSLTFLTTNLRRRLQVICFITLFCSLSSWFCHVQVFFPQTFEFYATSPVSCILGQTPSVSNSIWWLEGHSGCVLSWNPQQIPLFSPCSERHYCTAPLDKAADFAMCDVIVEKTYHLSLLQTKLEQWSCVMQSGISKVKRREPCTDIWGAPVLVRMRLEFFFADIH